MKTPRKAKPSLTVPEGQEGTHEILIKYYDEKSKQLEDEITRRLSDKVWDGIRRSYYRDGSLWCEDTWREGKLWSVDADFLPDGRPVEGSSIKEGQGHQKIYSEQGIFEGEGERLDGLREGLWTYYYPSGKKKEEATLVKNQLCGVRRLFSEEGVLTTQEEYTEKSCYHQKLGPDGAITVEGGYRIDSKNQWVKAGIWKTYEARGAVRFNDYDGNQSYLSYYAPEAVLEAYHAHQEVKARALAMVNACGGSVKALAGVLLKLSGAQSLHLSAELRVAICCLPAVGALDFSRSLRYERGAAPLLEEARRALLLGEPEDLTCLNVMLVSHLLAQAPVPDDFDLVLYKASRALMSLDPQLQYTEGETVRALLSTIPLPRREAIVFGHDSERSTERLCLQLVGACPTEAVLEATLTKIFATDVTSLSYQVKPGILTLVKSLGDLAAERLIALEFDPKESGCLSLYLQLLAETHTEKAAFKLCEFIHQKHAGTEAKRGLIAHKDLALPALEAEIKAQSGPKQAKAAMILSALPRSAAKRASAAALLQTTTGKTADYLMRAAK